MKPFTKRPENARMEQFLLDNGIKAKVRYLWKGSMKKTWGFYGKGQTWGPELIEKLTALGFNDFDGRPLHKFSSNGSEFAVSVTGHLEMVEGLTPGAV